MIVVTPLERLIAGRPRRVFVACLDGICRPGPEVRSGGDEAVWRRRTRRGVVDKLAGDSVLCQQSASAVEPGRG